MKQKAFTLAEIMVVLTVLGVLAAVLVPSAFKNRPDENLLKFQKANETLYGAINELISSDKYYLGGDLGIKPDGTPIDGSNDGDDTYFCDTFADILSVKTKNCSVVETDRAYADLRDGYVDGNTGQWVALNYTLDDVKSGLDRACKSKASTIGAEIVTSDNISYFQSSGKYPFGVGYVNRGSEVSETNPRLFGSNVNSSGFDQIYKIFCIDIDGIDKGEDPFGYGIRADGKIITGARADEWLAKSITDEE